MNTRNILLAIFLGLLLVQIAVGAAAAKESIKNANAAAKDAKDTVKEAVKDAAKDVKAAAQDKKETVKEAVKDAATDIKDKAQATKEAAKEVKENVKAAATDAKETVKAAATGAKENVKAAANDAKETVKEAAKEVPKQKTPPKFPKEEEAPKQDASYLPIAIAYVEKAKELGQQYAKLAAEYGAVAWAETKKYGGSAAVLAQEYSVTLSEAVAEYKEAVGAYTHAHAVDIIDKFLDPQHAALLKKNFLNWYGVALVIANIVGLYLVVKHLKWALSPKASQLFLTAVSLGIYITLASLTILTSNDPTTHIPASTLATIRTGLFYLSIATTVLNVLALVFYSGRGKSFVVALLSVGLFAEELDLHSHIEGALGTIPEYSLHALVYLLQAALVFDSIPSGTPVVEVKPKNVSVKSQEIKIEKTEKGEKAKKSKAK